MITMCELCQSCKKVEPLNTETPTNNQCFKERRYPEAYRPFKKDKTLIRLTCDGFSHIKTAVLGLRGGGSKTFHATPETPRIDLSDLGPMFK